MMFVKIPSSPYFCQTQYSKMQYINVEYSTVQKSTVNSTNLECLDVCEELLQSVLLLVKHKVL